MSDAGVPLGSKSTRIFLSYGRADASSLANRLRSDLQSSGYHVWQDIEFMTAGQAWTDQIRSRLAESDVVIALLTPHAVRRTYDRDNPGQTDSVCLDELAIARFSSPPIPIVPVMSLQCAPPFEVFRLDYVDMTRAADEPTYQQTLKRLLEGVEAASAGRPVPFRRWCRSLPVMDFASQLETKRRDFVGREWLFDDLRKWLDDSERERALLVIGDPGIGKSSFVAEMIRRNPDDRILAYHICRADNSETLKPGSIIRSLAGMIAGRAPEFADLLESPHLQQLLDPASVAERPEHVFDEVIVGGLCRLPPPAGGPRLMLFDALDESLSDAGLDLVTLLASRVDQFPPWLRIVATTRNDPDVLGRLSGLRATQINAHGSDNHNDISRFVDSRLESPTLQEKLRGSGVTPDEVKTQLQEKADGNFLYISQTLQDIERDVYSFERLGELPKGLHQWYLDWFERAYPQPLEFARQPRKVLEVLLASAGPLTETTLAAATGLDAGYELPLVLTKLSTFLQVDEGRYRIYHKALADWLVTTASPYHIDVGEGHLALAGLGERELSDSDGEPTTYTLHHTVTHLLRLSDHDRVRDFVASGGLMRIARLLGRAPALAQARLIVERFAVDNAVPFPTLIECAKGFCDVSEQPQQLTEVIAPLVEQGRVPELLSMVQGEPDFARRTILATAIWALFRAGQRPELADHFEQARANRSETSLPFPQSGLVRGLVSQAEEKHDKSPTSHRKEIGRSTGPVTFGETIACNLLSLPLLFYFFRRRLVQTALPLHFRLSSDARSLFARLSVWLWTWGLWLAIGGLVFSLAEGPWSWWQFALLVWLGINGAVQLNSQCWNWQRNFICRYLVQYYLRCCEHAKRPRNVLRTSRHLARLSELLHLAHPRMLAEFDEEVKGVVASGLQRLDKPQDLVNYLVEVTFLRKPVIEATADQLQALPPSTVKEVVDLLGPTVKRVAYPANALGLLSLLANLGQAVSNPAVFSDVASLASRSVRRGGRPEMLASFETDRRLRKRGFNILSNLTGHCLADAPPQVLAQSLIEGLDQTAQGPQGLMQRYSSMVWRGISFPFNNDHITQHFRRLYLTLTNYRRLLGIREILAALLYPGASPLFLALNSMVAMQVLAIALLLALACILVAVAALGVARPAFWSEVAANPLQILLVVGAVVLYAIPFGLTVVSTTRLGALRWRWERVRRRFQGWDAAEVARVLTNTVGYDVSVLGWRGLRELSLFQLVMQREFQIAARNDVFPDACWSRVVRAIRRLKSVALLRRVVPLVMNRRPLLQQLEASLRSYQGGEDPQQPRKDLVDRELGRMCHPGSVLGRSALLGGVACVIIFGAIGLSIIWMPWLTALSWDRLLTVFWPGLAAFLPLVLLHASERTPTGSMPYRVGRAIAFLVFWGCFLSIFQYREVEADYGLSAGSQADANGVFLSVWFAALFWSLMVWVTVCWIVALFRGSLSLFPSISTRIGSSFLGLALACVLLLGSTGLCVLWVSISDEEGWIIVPERREQIDGVEQVRLYEPTGAEISTAYYGPNGDKAICAAGYHRTEPTALGKTQRVPEHGRNLRFYYSVDDQPLRLVARIKAVEPWNNLSQEETILPRVGDVILAVNGITGSPAALQEEWKQLQEQAQTEAEVIVLRHDARLTLPLRPDAFSLELSPATVKPNRVVSFGISKHEFPMLLLQEENDAE